MSILYSGSVIYTEKWGKKGAENGSKLFLQGLTRTYQIFGLMFSQLSTSSPPQRFHLTYLQTGRPPKNYSKLVIHITNFHKQLHETGKISALQVPILKVACS